MLGFILKEGERTINRLLGINNYPNVTNDKTNNQKNLDSGFDFSSILSNSSRDLTIKSNETKDNRDYSVKNIKNRENPNERIENKNRKDFKKEKNNIEEESEEIKSEKDKDVKKEKIEKPKEEPESKTEETSENNNKAETDEEREIILEDSEIPAEIAALVQTSAEIQTETPVLEVSSENTGTVSENKPIEALLTNTETAETVSEDLNLENILPKEELKITVDSKIAETELEAESFGNLNNLSQKNINTTENILNTENVQNIEEIEIPKNTSTDESGILLPVAAEPEVLASDNKNTDLSDNKESDNFDNSINQVYDISNKNIETEKLNFRSIYGTFSKVNQKNVVDQIMNRIKFEIKENVSTIRITLHPETLGDVSLKIVSENGIISAQFMAENEKIKEIIEANFNMLKDVLKEKGIEISSLSVSVGNEQKNSEFESFSQPNLSKRNTFFEKKEIAISATIIEKTYQLDVYDASVYYQA